MRELAGADPAALAAELGPALGPWYVQLGRGVGRVEVRGEPWLARSRGHEETFAVDLTDWAEVRAAAAGLARRVAADVLAEGRPAARVGVKVRFVPFITRTRSTTLAEPTSDTADDRGHGAGACSTSSPPDAPSGWSGSARSSPPDAIPKPLVPTSELCDLVPIEVTGPWRGVSRW